MLATGSPASSEARPHIKPGPSAEARASQRRGDVVRVHPLRRGAAEAIEAVAHGDRQTSKVIGRALGDLNLPSGTSVGAIVRGDQVIIAHDNILVEADDHLILFLVDKSRLKEVEALFQAPVSFF